MRQYEERAKIARRMDRGAFSAVPTLKDPKLFMVKCKNGFEKEMALSVGNKYLQLLKTDQAISPISASAIDKISGYIYIEAVNKFQAEKACRGFMKLNYSYLRVTFGFANTQRGRYSKIENALFEITDFLFILRFEDDAKCLNEKGEHIVL